MMPQSIGRYEIKAELGRGGMATVYRAYDPRFKREVALKVLPSQFTHDPQFRARFEREAQTIAALEHSAIVPVYDFGEDPHTEQPYIVMRLMTGGSLAERLEGGPVSLAEAARIFPPLASALDKAHAQGVIHRDLKPGNILFDTENNPYISDFGIVKLTEATASYTGSGLIGTPAYMSPEQVRGDHRIDGRSDIYALGVILFQMLTGKLPYQADTPMGMAVKHLTEPPPRILETRPDLPKSCDTLIQKAMAKNRDERYATANGMAGTLANMAAVPPNQSAATLNAAALPETLPARPDLTSRKRHWGIRGLVGMTGLVILAVVVILWFSRRPEVPMAEGLPVTASHTPFRTRTASPSPTVPSLTPTPRTSPTVTQTPTSRPTRKPTPPPAWVTDFAEPLLAAIHGKQPDFQDDFDDNSGGWRLVDWNVNLGYRLIYADGEMTISSGPSPTCCTIHHDMWYPDFVIEMDYRYLHSTWRWSFGYRYMGQNQGSTSNNLTFYQNGDLEATFVGSNDGITRFPGVALVGDRVNHVLLIAKDQEFALFINDRPVFYKKGEPVYPNGGIMIDVDDAVAIDNFKLWDLSDVVLEGGIEP